MKTDYPEIAPPGPPMRCPNCEALMHEGESCPECSHDDGLPWCDCDSCADGRSDDEDEIPEEGDSEWTS